MSNMTKTDWYAFGQIISEMSLHHVCGTIGLVFGDGKRDKDDYEKLMVRACEYAEDGDTPEVRKKIELLIKLYLEEKV
jgi:hypothetical protein